MEKVDQNFCTERQRKSTVIFFGFMTNLGKYSSLYVQPWVRGILVSVIFLERGKGERERRAGEG
jgi:hypothetical protein